MRNPVEIIEDFRRLTVLVIGEAMLDSYLRGTADRLCREAPVPIVTVTEREDAPGGGANTAVNVRSLGAQVHLLSIVGDDDEGRLLHQTLAEHGVATEAVLPWPGRRTHAKHRVMAGAQMLVRFDLGSTEPLDAGAEAALETRLRALWSDCDAVIISDYGYGILSPRVTRAIAELQARQPRVLVADSKDLARFRALGVTAVKPNYDELRALLGAARLPDDQSRADAVAAMGHDILDLTGARIVAATLDTDGGVIIERGRPAHRVYARPTSHARAAGAGDTFVSALTLALAAGADTPAAAEIASAAAAVVVARDGTAACAADELRAALTGAEGRLIDLESLVARVRLYRQAGQRIVFTNGCFDLLHRGHITLLNRAKALGDVLIVGLNADASVARLKGEGRPIMGLEDRAQVMSALSCVDHIVAFDDDTPRDLLRVIRPDIVVKGGDYTRESLPEATLVEALGGVVRILPLLHDRSTRGIIDQIRSTAPAPDDRVVSQRPMLELPPVESAPAGGSEVA